MDNGKNDTDATFWRRKAAEFEAREADSLPIRLELWDVWTMRVVVPHGTDDRDVVMLQAIHAAQQDFAALAESAAVALGEPPGPHAWRQWVDGSLSKGFDCIDTWDDRDEYFRQRPGIHAHIPNGWKASARCCRNIALQAEIEQIANNRTAQPADIDPKSSPSAEAPKAQNGSEHLITDQEDAPLLDRATWLAAEMKKRDMTPYALNMAGGPDEKSIRKILEGKPVRDDVLHKVVAGLSHKDPAVSVGDIPRS